MRPKLPWWLVRTVRVGRVIVGVVSMGCLGWLLYTTRETVSCSYAGPPRNVLTITLKNAGGELRRAGGQIIVAKDDGSQVFCSGGTPTVRNTDTIRAKLGDIDSLELWLGNGPLEPGATAERDGRSEIEIVASGVDASLDVVGTPADETWQWGPGREQPGLNLNAGRSGDRDVDVTITGAGSSISADAAAGNDRVGAGPAVDIAADASRTSPAAAATTSCARPATAKATSPEDRATTRSPVASGPTTSTARRETTSSTCATTRATRSTAGPAAIASERTGATGCAAARSSAGADAARGGACVPRSATARGT
jgi:hypothetical protein